MKFFLLLILVGLLSSSCREDNASPTESLNYWNSQVPFSLNYDVTLSELGQSNLFSDRAETRGASDLIEASGIGMGLVNQDYLWAQQDKGNPNEIYLINKLNAETVASFKLEGITNRDWEDLELGPGPEEGESYIYLGEIGDNNRVYPDYKIYRFKEPVWDDPEVQSSFSLPDDAIETITFTYPDGLRHDAETLLLDPWTKDLFIVTKRDVNSIIYVLPYPQSTGKAMEAIRVGTFPFNRAVGGSISSDGKEMLIKTYDFILHWERAPGESMKDFFQKHPKLAPYNPIEPQGEAICFDIDNGYYTLSEFSEDKIPPLYYYQRIKP